MISLDLMESSEVRIAGDQPKYTIHQSNFRRDLTVDFVRFIISQKKKH